MIRVAIVNHHGGPPAGAEQALLLYLDALRDSVEPVFFIFEQGEFVEVARTRYGSVTVVPMSKRVARSTRASIRWGGAFDALDLTRRLAKALRKANVDLVLTNTLKAHVVGSMAAKLAGLPCVNYMHDVLDGMARTLVGTSSRIFGDARFACSNGVDRNLALPRTQVVYSPLDLNEYAALPSAADSRRALGLPIDGLPVVGLVGRFLRWKGQDVFIRIARRVLDRVDAHFAIVGGPIFGCDPEYPKELHDLVNRLDLRSRVHFVGWQRDLRQVYASLDISCNCSVREPFGRTTVEALAAGVPAVSFDDAGVCELFSPGNAGTRAIPAGDEAAFATAVIGLIEEPGMLGVAAAAAREVAKQVEVEAMALKFAAVLEETARRRWRNALTPARAGASSL